MIVNLANLSRSCLRPTFSNSTVILQLSPVSSMAVTVPFPKRAWQMNVPISTCPAAVATVDCVVEWVSPVGLESILVNRLPGDGAVNGLGAGVRSYLLRSIGKFCAVFPYRMEIGSTIWFLWETLVWFVPAYRRIENRGL